MILKNWHDIYINQHKKTKLIMKNLSIKLAVPVLFSLFVAFSASAQTQPASTAAATSAAKPAISKQDRINEANQKIAEAQQKINSLSKDPKNAATVSTLQADLNSYKSALAAYSTAKGPQEQTTGQQLKTAHEKLASDWNAAKEKAAANTPATPKK